MGNRVSYRCTGSVGHIAMDDGKVNVLSPSMLAELGGAMDQAERDEAAVVLTGKPGLFSAGFDLGVLKGGGEDALAMLKDGFLLGERILSFPYPVVVACSGHAVAMALFLVLCADYRIGVTGEARLTANEVAIGLPMPRAAIEICRQRLTPAAFTRVVILAEPFSGEQAVAAGLLDALVDPSALDGRADEVATALRGLDMAAHRSTKLRARAKVLEALHAAIEQDDADLRAIT
jgi:enoyl-CoA hydratase